MYIMQRPRYPLNRFIECLWYVNVTVAYNQERILPTGTVEFIINFADGFRLVDMDGPGHDVINHESWLVGLQTQALVNHPLGKTHMVGVRFKPGGTYPFFPFPANEVYNTVVDADCVWGQTVHDLREDLRAQSEVAARFEILEQWLLAQLDAPRLHDINGIHASAEAIMQARGAVSIKTLGDQIGMSQKHLANQFKRIVGVPPKTLARIFRFQHVLQSIRPGQTLNWADIAHECHYNDQSHFNRDFVDLTGVRPSDYVALRTAAFGCRC